MKQQKKNKVEHKGSFMTSTVFERESGSTIKVNVWLSSSVTWAGNYTFWHFSIEIKGYKCRNYRDVMTSNDSKDKRFREFITDQELYEAYNNHWNKLNPYRIFAKGQLNSDLVNFSVKKIEELNEYKSF